MNRHAPHAALARAQLYAILDLSYVSPSAALGTAQALLAGGAGILQLRAKNHHPQAISSLAADLLALCRAHGVPFLINDFVSLAAEIGADGCHVGQDDTPVAEVRAALPPGSIVGLSTHSIEQVRSAITARPDYIGFGPLFATPTKPDYTPIGLSMVREALSLAPFPVFCIGGITLETLPQVLQAGATRVVMVSALLKAPNPQHAAAQALGLMQSST